MSYKIGYFSLRTLFNLFLEFTVGVISRVKPQLSITKYRQVSEVVPNPSSTFL